MTRLLGQGKGGMRCREPQAVGLLSTNQHLVLHVSPKSCHYEAEWGGGISFNRAAVAAEEVNAVWSGPSIGWIGLARGWRIAFLMLRNVVHPAVFRSAPASRRLSGERSIGTFAQEPNAG